MENFYIANWKMVKENKIVAKGILDFTKEMIYMIWQLSNPLNDKAIAAIERPKCVKHSTREN